MNITPEGIFVCLPLLKVDFLTIIPIGAISWSVIFMAPPCHTSLMECFLFIHFSLSVQFVPSCHALFHAIEDLNRVQVSNF